MCVNIETFLFYCQHNQYLFIKVKLKGTIKKAYWNKNFDC